MVRAVAALMRKQVFASLQVGRNGGKEGEIEEGGKGTEKSQARDPARCGAARRPTDLEPPSISRYRPIQFSACR